MTVLTFRSHTRFAMRQPVSLASEGRRKLRGLLIELSAEGCRVSGLGKAAFAMEQTVTVDIAGSDPLAGRIRWTGDGVAGLRFDRVLTHAQLQDLLALTRGPVEIRRYAM
jgi:hypothetical protein